MEDNKDNVMIIELSNYVKPNIQESRSRDWVLNGDKNSFFNYVIDRYNGSPTNGAIIRGFSNLIYGKGLSAHDASRKPMQYAEMKSLLSANDLRKVVLDYKLQGQFAIQVVYNNDRSINKLLHHPIETLAPEKMNQDGEIEAYYYSGDWTKSGRQEYKPVRIPSFGTSKEGIEIFVAKPYNPGQMYFSLPDYIQGLQYAETEEEISNFYINHIKNGLSFGYIINFNNGDSLSEDQKEQMRRQIKRQLTGSTNAGKFILSFNNDKEHEVTITKLDVNQAHKQWESLNQETEEKILRAHKVVSPMLFGIKNNTGLGNNAEELKTANALLMDMSINPMQDFIIDNLRKLFAINGIALDLFFIPLNEEEQKQEVEEQVSTNLHTCLSKNKEAADILISMGEDINLDDWEVIDERPCDKPTLTEERLGAVLEFAKAPSGDSRKSSEQDTSLFKIRYKYAGNPNPQREFCKKVIQANKVYRVEDIEKASNEVVNAGFGANGTDTYNIWFYKGGVNCKHFWERKIYLKKGNKKISVNEARRMILALEPQDRADARWEQNDKLVAQPAQESNNFFKLN